MPKKAKTITQNDLKKLLDFVAANKHDVCNRTMLLAMHLASTRVGEVASLRYGDVVDNTGAVRDQINLRREQTKDRHARAEFVNAKFRRELEAYLTSHPMHDAQDRLFHTHKRQGRICLKHSRSVLSLHVQASGYCGRQQPFGPANINYQLG
jgi:integrase/recombinase XerD